MIYFRSLLSKSNLEIFLFQSVVRLITNARQNFETFEVNETRKKNKRIDANWKLDYSCFRSSLCLRMFTKSWIISYLVQKDLEIRTTNERQGNLELIWLPGKKNNIAFSRSCSTSIIETNSKLICVVLEYSLKFKKSESFFLDLEWKLSLSLF